MYNHIFSLFWFLTGWLLLKRDASYTNIYFIKLPGTVRSCTGNRRQGRWKENFSLKQNFENFVSSRKRKKEFSFHQPYVFQMYRQQKTMSLKGKFSQKQKFRFFAKIEKRIFVTTLCVPDVSTAEGNVAGTGQHQRRGVVQAPGQLTAEDAQVQ